MYTTSATSWRLTLSCSRDSNSQWEVVSQDRTKCFDLLEWDIGFNTMRALGCPQKPISAEKKFMDNIQQQIQDWIIALTEPAEQNKFHSVHTGLVKQKSLAMHDGRYGRWTCHFTDGPQEVSFDDSNFRVNNDRPTDEELHTTSAEDVLLERLSSGINGMCHEKLEDQCHDD